MQAMKEEFSKNSEILKKSPEILEMKSKTKKLR
jgi:hypothetical protein